ncbi:urea transporter [Lederbergia panacisoli]|uniref:urea transporter n=1 Tax=Lederbergia panacisoli TaxID=1255251 RepID=UPI00214BBF2C|nr:urea transporter [Lederbergia panacisoli]MCR2821616.1 urea transporter [Lederbergia panacisoli]
MKNHHRKSKSVENILQFLITSMKGLSQVILIENALTGVIILIAISCSSLALGIISLLSSVIGTLIGKIGGADDSDIRQGLFGFNSVLTGLALMLFMSGTSRWFIALFGAAVAALLTAAFMHLMKFTELAVLTTPFIILTWFVLLTTYKLKYFHLSEKLVPQDLSSWNLIIEGDINWIEGAISGIGQIFFLDNTLSGILLFIAVFIEGWRLGLFAVIGNAVALFVSYWLGAEHLLIYAGLYGYNAILATMAVGTVFTGYKLSGHSIFVGILAAILTVPLTASVTTWLLPYGLPALTMPYVLCTWIFLGAKKVLPSL